MKYLKATVIVGFNEDEMEDWDEHSDLTRALQDRGLHNPDIAVYLHDHDLHPYITEKQFRKMHKCIDEYGGI